nr:hypothetical protein GCM10020063_069420 [Dactylosporangium thailandense]
MSAAARIRLRSWRPRGFSAVVTGTSLALVTMLLTGIPAHAAPKRGIGDEAGAPSRSVPVSKVPAREPIRTDSNARRTHDAPPSSWPVAGSADTDSGGAGVQPGGLPVRVTGDGNADAAPRTRAELSAAGRVPVRVTVADQGVATAAGVHGVVLRVSRSDGRAERASVGLTVSYAQFANGYGADYASRLRLVSLPACALTTPSARQCQAQTPVTAVNDTAARTLTAQSVPVGGAATILAIASSSDGSSGSAQWTATDLSPAYSWASGTAGGDFTLSYPIKAPASLGGPAPDLAFNYSSGSVDAKTAAKTGQSSVVGEGWEMSGAGYVERAFRSCVDDGGTSNDMCWVSGDSMTMVLGGRSVRLVKDANGWHTSIDDKWRVEQVYDSTSAHNNAVNGEYWKVTATDGTQYYFGKLHRYVGDTADTASVQTEPVVGNATGEPCNTSPGNMCQQAYRWNLDYVVDPRGNSMTYFYSKFLGSYGAKNNTSVQPYDLSARLERIEYGTRAGSEASAAAPTQVLFGYSERCWNNCNWHTSGYADTPMDLYCDLGASSCANALAPMHFTRYRMSSVTTQVRSGSAYRNVDKWDMDQTFLSDPNNMTPPNLALTALTHTGYAADGVTALAEPAVTFTYTAKENRTDWSASLGMAPFIHYRLETVANGVGGQTVVSYLPTDCTNGWPKINDDSNPYRCFPQYYKPPAAPAGWGWFNKYVVGSVTEQDLTGGSPDEVTSYDYSLDGSSDTSLWAHDDVDMASVNLTSWADWRGYPTVTVTDGAVSGQQTVSRTVYHRGLNADAKKDGNETGTLFGQRPTYTLDALQQAEEVPVGLSGGGGPGNGGLCLDIMNGVNADGTTLQTVACNNLPWQQWLHVPPGLSSYPYPNALLNPITGKCVDVKNSGTANGTQVWLYTCNGGAAQRWLRQPDGTMKNPNSGKCLDVAGTNIAGGGTMQIYDCAAQWNQVWMPTGKGEWVQSQAVRCAVAASTADAAQIQNQMCGVNPANQTWQLQRDGTVVNPGSGKCLDVANGLTAAGTPVQLYPCNQSAAQQWVAQADGSLKGVPSGRCLDAGATAAYNQVLVINNCTGALSQKWVGRTQDHQALNGQIRASYTMNGGAVDAVTVHRYTTPQTGSRAAIVNPAATLYAFITRENQTKTATWVAATGKWRWSHEDKSFDGYGLPTDVKDWNELGNNDDNVCTHTDYAHNDTATKYLINFPSQVVVTDCATTPGPNNYLQGTQTLYDTGTTVGAAPTAGLATKVNALASVTGTTLSWTQDSRSTYDPYGRPLNQYDALDALQTTIAYTPVTGGPVTASSSTDSLGHKVTTGFEPGHGSVVSIVDANLKTTTAQYDPLGRLTKVYKPHNPSLAVPDIEYAYTVSGSVPNDVVTKVLGPNGNQIVSHQLYDGRLRTRQQQEPAAQAKGGRIVTDTVYDARGLTAKQTVFWNSTAPGGTLLSFADTDSGIKNQHRYAYDFHERLTDDALYSSNVQQWHTATGYDGDRSWTLPPAGGTATLRRTDVNGNLIELRQFLTGAPPNGTDYRATTYVYDQLGRLTKVIDPSSAQWTRVFDKRGRITSTSDPDKGGTTFVYDDTGLLTTQTDARGSISYKYDSAGRKTGAYDGVGTSGFKRAAWEYDTLQKGQLTSTTRYVGSDAYTSTVGSYDDGYHPLSVTIGIPLAAGLPSGMYTAGTAYNADGSVASNTYPAVGIDLAAETVSYGYDDTGRLLTVGGQDPYVAATTYTSLGAVTQRVLGSGTKKVRQTTLIDEATGRPTTTSTETQNQSVTTNWDERLTEQYGFDNAGNLKSVKETSAASPAPSQCFNYDALQQLTEAWTTTAAACQATPTQPVVGGADAYWSSYAYNSAGGRSNEVVHSASGDLNRAYTYPATGQVHTLSNVQRSGSATGSDTFGYDATGNMTSRTVAGRPAQTLAWDAEGLLSSVTDSNGVTSYIYDANGNRLVAKDPSGATAYLGDFEVRLAGGNLTGMRYYRAAGQTVASRTSAGLTWLSGDLHRTAVLAVKASDLTATRRKLDPFGNPRGADPAWPNSRGFVGGTRDGTGLTHLGAREYDPTTGRFISRDPIFQFDDPQQTNGYGYAANNPTTAHDASGRSTCRGDEDCADDPCRGNPSCHAGKTPPPAPRCTQYDTKCKQPPKQDPKQDPKQPAKPKPPAKPQIPSWLKWAAEQVEYWGNLVSNILGLIPGFVCSFCAVVSLVLNLLVALAQVILGKIFDAIVTVITAGLGVLFGGLSLPKAGQLTGGLTGKMADMFVTRLIRQGEVAFERTFTKVDGKYVVKTVRSGWYKRIEKYMDVFASAGGTILSAAGQLVQDEHDQKGPWTPVDGEDDD